MPGKNRHRKTSSAAHLLGMMDKAGSSLPHLSEVAEHFIDLAGGPRQVAKMLFDEYNAAPAGGVTRQRLLDMISRVWKFGSETVGQSHDPEEMSDEELNAELAEIMEDISDASEANQKAGNDPAPAGGSAAEAGSGAGPQPANHEVPVPAAPGHSGRKGPPPPGSFEPL